MKNSKRANGDGSIYYEKSRERWVCAIVDPSGKRIIKRFKTEQEAKDHLTITKSSILTNAYIQPNQITFGQWLIDYITLYVKPNAQPTTILTYANYCMYAEPLNEMPIQKLNANNLQKLINELPQTLSPTTRHDIAMLYKRALKKAYNTKLITFNPMEDVVIPKKVKPDVETFSIEEMNKILQYLENKRNSYRDYAIFKTAFATGMRIGEILALQHTDIGSGHIVVSKTIKRNLKHETIVGITKGKVTRTIDVPASVIAMLKRLQPNNEGFIFYSRSKKLLTEGNLRNSWELILKKSGVPYRKIHAIRHTHATQLLENGVSITDVSRRLGHASITITLETYAHVLNDKDHKSQLVSKITDIFKM